MPYASIEDLRAAGLGIINESDAWMTGRPYGLPGTATIRLDQQHGGYHDPNGYHYNAAMVGGGFGDADTQALTAALQAQMQQLIEAQRVQQESLKRIATVQTAFFWIVAASVAGSFIGTMVTLYRRRR